MTIREAMKEKQLSVYRLAKTSELPYATVNDICNEKHVWKSAVRKLFFGWPVRWMCPWNR